MKEFWLCFIPLFVAVDPIGILPLFLGLTDRLDTRKRRKIALQSMTTALVVGLLFLVLGKWILRVLGISIADFMIAGGILLLAFSVSDLLLSEKPQRRVDQESLGVVPLAFPLMVGPAVLTAGMILIDEYGLLYTAVALSLNISLAGLENIMAPVLPRRRARYPENHSTKLASLLLAAFAVMMVRKGIFELLGR